MITTAEARQACLALTRRLETETCPLAQAAGRVLAADLVAGRDQPPFASAAMDGYAVQNALVSPGAGFQVVGTAAAGHAWEGRLTPGEAVRIFTGAPVPQGADRVIIQEDVTREGDRIRLAEGLDPGPYIRPAGMDFPRGFRLPAPRRLGPADLALAAAMNHAELPVTRRPDVALIATGDELVPPGTAPAPDQIVASNSYGLKALIEAAGGRARLLPIARDTTPALTDAFDMADGADLIVTLGGASVGDHDLVAAVAAERGLERAFYKIAMRPGKPLMAGKIGATAMIGLPGNPVSSMVCGYIFILPMLRAFLGLPADPPRLSPARLTVPMGPNGPREHYMRAQISQAETGPEITPADSQDSALLTRLAEANAFLVRPPHDPARAAGDLVSSIPLSAFFD